MAQLCDMTALNSAAFTLQERSTIAGALIRLSCEGPTASEPIGSVLAYAAPQLAAAASSGRQGSMDAAQHVPALLSLLAEYPIDTSTEAKAVATSAMLLIDTVAPRVKPDLLAAMLCAPPPQCITSPPAHCRFVESVPIFLDLP